jgi:hypothetical protein
MGIARFDSEGTGESPNGSLPPYPDLVSQSPAVLGVKPAIKDVDAQVFLAFHCAKLKTKLSPTAYFDV